jgi:serine/threonine protein kinase
MSPEQLRGEPIDLRTDIYALGVILYEALGGSQPYPGASFADLVLTIATQDPKPLGELAPGLPPKLLDLVGRAMSRDPSRRFESVEQMGRALAALSGGLAFAADTGDPSTRISKTQQRTPSSERLRTPFSTELEQPRVSTGDLDLGRPPTLPMIAGVGVAAAAVLALGVAAFMLLRAPDVKVPTTPAASGTAATTATTATTQPTHPSVGQDIVNPVLPPGAGTELPATNSARIGQDQQADDLQNPQLWNRPENTGGGVVDPAGLGADHGSANRIRLGPGRASHSAFGGSATERSSSGRRYGRRPKADARGAVDDSPEPKRDDAKEQFPKTFRSFDRGQGMTPDDF